MWCSAPKGGNSCLLTSIAAVPWRRVSGRRAWQVFGGQPATAQSKCLSCSQQRCTGTLICTITMCMGFRIWLSLKNSKSRHGKNWCKRTRKRTKYSMPNKQISRSQRGKAFQTTSSENFITSISDFSSSSTARTPINIWRINSSLLSWAKSRKKLLDSIRKSIPLNTCPTLRKFLKITRRWRKPLTSLLKFTPPRTAEKLCGSASDYLESLRGIILVS